MPMMPWKTYKKRIPEVKAAQLESLRIFEVQDGEPVIGHEGDYAVWWDGDFAIIPKDDFELNFEEKTENKL